MTFMGMPKGSRTAFPKRLVLAYKTTYLTPKDISEKTKISLSALSNYKNGRQLPSWDNLTKLAQAFGTTESWLLGLDQISTPTVRKVPELMRKVGMPNQETILSRTQPEIKELVASSADATDEGVNMYAYRIVGSDSFRSMVSKLPPRHNASPREKHLLARAMQQRFKHLVNEKASIIRVLSEATQLSTQAISNILRGLVYPRPSTLLLIATALRTSPIALENEGNEEIMLSTPELSAGDEITEMLDTEIQAARYWNDAHKYPETSNEYKKAILVWQRYVLANVPQTIDIDAVDCDWLKDKKFHTITLPNGDVLIDWSCSDGHFEFEILG